MKSKITQIFFSNLEQIEAYGFPISLLIIVYGLFISLVNPVYYDSIYTLRNGFVCSLEQLFLFLMTVLFFWRAIYWGAKKQNYILLFSYLALSLVCFFGFGEKVRWGQFILELKLPQIFAEHNTQGQITIHNLKFGNFSVNKTIFGKLLGLLIFIYTLVIPFMYYKGSQFIRKIVGKFGIPIPKKSQIAWYLLTVSVALSIPLHKKGELVQFAGVWSFLMIFAFPENYEQIRNTAKYNP